MDGCVKYADEIIKCGDIVPGDREAVVIFDEKMCEFED
jgi:hypothetical protein